MSSRYLVAAVILFGALHLGEVQATLTTNAWTAGSGKWETAGNWSAGAPTITHSANLITNATSKTVTIDALTPAGTLTISNLVISGPSGTLNTLQLTNAPASTLHVLNSLSISNGGALLVTNSTVLVGAPTYGMFLDDATVTLIDGTMIATNLMVVGNEDIGAMMANTGKLVTGVFYLGYNSGSQGSLIMANGSQLITSNQFAPVYLGFSGAGQMLISNSTWLAGGGSSLYLGFGAGAQGTLTMAGSTVTALPFVDVGLSYGGTGSVWQTGGSMIATNGTFYIGDEGVGQMTVSNGTWQSGEVLVSYNPGSSGTLTLIGGANQLTGGLNIAGQSGGSGETGAVWVTGGQLIMTNTYAVVGSTGNGQMTVSNATWLVNEVDVAEFDCCGQGTLTLVGSTIVVSDIFSAGADDTTVTGVVWLTGSQLTVNGPTYVGWFGDGQMTVSNGTWLANYAYVGFQTGSQGTLSIAGGTNILSSYLDIGGQTGATGALWMTGGQLLVTNSLLIVSEGGVGQMTVSNGTCMAASVDVGGAPGAQGTLTVAGGAITIFGDLSVGVGGTQTLWQTGGQLTVTNGATTIAHLDVGRMTVSNGAWRTRNVVVGGQPGSQGTLTVAGGVSSVYSNVTIGGTNCSASDFVFVTGGELHVTNDDATGVLEVRDGTLIQTGGLLDIDRLVSTNPCAHFMHLGGTLIIGLETLSPNLDADGDGIPNGYELANGMDPLNPGDASLDNDGDGMSNLQEYLAGTDPNNSASYFHITVAAKEGNNVRITWTTVGGRTNQVFLNPPSVNGGPTDGVVPLSPLFFIPGTGASTTNYLDVGGATNVPPRYYRVHLIP